MKQTHDKIKELMLRAAPVTMSGSYVDAQGNLRTIDFKIEASETNRTIKGYLAVWGVEDTYGTVFVKGCFAKSIAERGPDSQSKQKIAHLWMHDCSDPSGKFTVLKEDNYGLYFEAELDDVPTGERELRQIRSGTLNQFSVGFDYVWDKMEYDEEKDVVIIMEAILMEGSVVTFGSNAETYAMRTPEQLVTAKENLREETEDFIKQLPRTKQLEFRQLIAKHISLVTAKPLESFKKRALDLSYEPTTAELAIGGYKLNVNEFKQ